MFTHAAVIPLHYSETRTEFSILLVGDHYDDLIRVLTDPQSVLFSERTSHKAFGNIPPRFDDDVAISFPYMSAAPDLAKPAFWMESPVTAIISHGYTFESGERGVGGNIADNPPRYSVSGFKLDELNQRDLLIGGGAPPVNADVFMLTALAERPSGGNGEEFPTNISATDFQKDLYPNGCVVCEFALSTRTLHITYYRSINGLGSFPGGITPVTVAALSVPTRAGEGGEPKRPRGTVHFDLLPKGGEDGKCCPSLRAAYIGQMLENPESMVSQVAQEKEFFFAAPSFAKRGEPYLGVSEPAKIGPQVFENTEGLVTNGAPAQIPLKINPNRMPDIIVDGLSVGEVGDEAEIEPCTVYEWREVPVGSGNWELVKVVVKVYEDRVAPNELFAHRSPGSQRPVSTVSPANGVITQPPGMAQNFARPKAIRRIMS